MQRFQSLKTESISLKKPYEYNIYSYWGFLISCWSSHIRQLSTSWSPSAFLCNQWKQAPPEGNWSDLPLRCISFKCLGLWLLPDVLGYVPKRITWCLQPRNHGVTLTTHCRSRFKGRKGHAAYVNQLQQDCSFVNKTWRDRLFLQALKSVHSLAWNANEVD